MTNESILVNKPESESFIATALAWHGSVTPIVLPRVAIAAVYSALICVLATAKPWFSIPITPFEYSGAVLALILVLRVNSGYDRWWEARKIWGSIVNQSRNLALVICGYCERDEQMVGSALKWIASWPHVMRESLRNEKLLVEVANILGPEEQMRIQSAEHMPTYVAYRITQILKGLRANGMDGFTFLRAEAERSLLIDAIGACERIRNTRLPYVLAVKTRRFIFLFILLLPFALVDRVDWFTPLVVALTAYPLFSLDEIGVELQNPFSSDNLSHLPLNSICSTIEKNILALWQVGDFGVSAVPQSTADPS